MSKKILSLALALVMCLGLTVPVFAEEEDVLPETTLQGPENSGIIYQSKAMKSTFMNFARSGSNNTHISYGASFIAESNNVRLVPNGVDIVVNGVKSAEDIILRPFFAADEEGTYLFARLFVWETGKDASLVPLDTSDPLKFEYDDPKDGKTNVAGTITAADAGFQVDENGSVVLNSERLYALLGEGSVLQILIGEDYSWPCLLSGEPYTVSDVFTDVDTGNWVSDPVAWALMNGITTGTSDTEFSSDENCTQAQILTFLYRAAREDQAESSAKDMESAVQWAREKGMIDDSFDGNTPCTRATAVSYIWQAFDKPAAGAPASFTDVDDNASFAGAVSWAVEKGITNGDGSDTVFSPDKVCNRGQIVTFLYRAYNN